MKHFLALILCACTASTPPPEESPRGSARPALVNAAPTKRAVEVTYIANYGVLLSDGTSRVLVDALFREGVSGYATVPKSTLEQLEGARPPFDDIDLVLVSHRHADHFDALSVGSHVLRAVQSQLVSSREVVDLLRRQVPEFPKIEARIHVAAPTGQRIEPRTLGGVEVGFFWISHGMEIENLGHVVTLGGLKILHVGDAEPDRELVTSLGLGRERIDIALLPFWLLTSASGRAIVDEVIQPKHVVALHVETENAASIEQQVRAHYPAAWIGNQSLETRR